MKIETEALGYTVFSVPQCRALPRVVWVDTEDPAYCHRLAPGVDQFVAFVFNLPLLCVHRVGRVKVVESTKLVLIDTVDEDPTPPEAVKTDAPAGVSA